MTRAQQAHLTENFILYGSCAHLLRCNISLIITYYLIMYDFMWSNKFHESIKYLRIYSILDLVIQMIQYVDSFFNQTEI